MLVFIVQVLLALLLREAATAAIFHSLTTDLFFAFLEKIAQS